ncbi:MAG: hypothetical protein FWC39_09605 [Bacteroidetes bacterium]|nr:hypothetical protein [Bacteroidota bacterium]
MQAVRQIMNMSDVSPFINLPWQNNGDMWVEVLVFPFQSKEEKVQSTTPKSMKGALKAYANPALIEQEKFAWEMNVKEKYGNI